MPHPIDAGVTCLPSTRERVTVADTEVSAEVRCTDCQRVLMDRLAYRRCPTERRGRVPKGARGRCQVCYNRAHRAGVA